MKLGLTMFPTEYSIAPAELARAAEQRGFESLWFPEHSHIPAKRESPWPGGPELPKMYYDVMEPFVALAAAAAVTTKLRVATGICLVVQRDPIQTAKHVATLDRVASGRFLFGIGAGWNAEEMRDHGTDARTRIALMRERVAAMKEIWTKSKAEFHGKYVDFEPIMTWPKPVQKPHPPVLLGGAFRFAARRAIRYGDGMLPFASSTGPGSPQEFMPVWRRMAEEGGRDPRSLSVTLGGAPEDLGVLRRNRDLGVTRMTVRLPPEKEDAILPMLDRWAKLIPQLRT